MSMNIGWVGLGNIGTGMVKQALAAGHQVTAYARGAGLGEVQAAGAKTSADHAAVAAQSDILGLCVFSDAQLREVLFDGGALAAMRSGAVVAIHTTGAPGLAREIGARAPVGVGVLDATFSGGAVQVAAGELVLMVGGEADAIDRARPLLETYANKIHHVGPLGQGQTLKLLNNLLFAANLQYAAEILKIAEQQGLKSWEVARIIQDCSGASYSMGLFQAQAPVAQMLAATKPYMEKDVATAASVAAEAGIDFAAFAPTVRYFEKD
jgi:3-hydroxyisobutyrate dehydrogenase